MQDRWPCGDIALTHFALPLAWLVRTFPFPGGSHQTEPWWIWTEDANNEHFYHTEYFVLQKKQALDTHKIVFTIPIFEPLPPQYFVRYAGRPCALAYIALVAHARGGLQKLTPQCRPPVAFSRRVSALYRTAGWGLKPPLRCRSSTCSCPSSILRYAADHGTAGETHDGQPTRSTAPPVRRCGAPHVGNGGAKQHTDVLNLQPLPITALQDERLEGLYAPNFLHFNPIQTQAFHTLYHTDGNVLMGAPTGSGADESHLAPPSTAPCLSMLTPPETAASALAHMRGHGRDVATGKTVIAEIAMWRAFRVAPKGKVRSPPARRARECTCAVRGRGRRGSLKAAGPQRQNPREEEPGA